MEKRLGDRIAIVTNLAGLCAVVAVLVEPNGLIGSRRIASQLALAC